MRKSLALGTVALSVLALVAMAAPANAATGTTTVALTVVDGTLAIVTTAAATGATSTIVGTSRQISSPLGITTITDTRAASTGWTLSAATSLFTFGGSTIPAGAAKFSISQAPITVLGTNSYVNTMSPSAGGSLTTASASGINTATVLPVLTVDVPNSAVTGLYTGTVTQSVV